jgi:hypothetical protein
MRVVLAFLLFVLPQAFDSASHALDLEPSLRNPAALQRLTVVYRPPIHKGWVPLKPRFSAKADISSGDNPNSKTLGTFNPLFPKGNYFGVLATTGPGPINQRHGSVLTSVD